MKKTIITILFFLVFPLSAFATVLERIPFNEQAIKADLVVIGKAGRIEDSKLQGFPFRRAIITITEVVSGEAPGSEIAVIQPGGKGPNGRQVRAEGIQYIKPGEELMLFLHRRPEGDYEIIGLSQGQYRIAGEAGTGRKIIHVMDRPGQAHAMTLDGARLRVHAVRANAGVDKNKPGVKKQ